MRKIIVTTSWDDGNKLDLKLAEILNKNNIKGTFYISPRNREFKREELLTDKDIVELNNEFEIGAHTMTHPRLTRIEQKDAYIEIIDSKKYLEDLTGKEVRSFCYPGGQYNKDIIKLVRKAGFCYSRTVKKYKFSPAEENLASGTTLEAYRISLLTLPVDSFRILAFSNFNLKKFFKSLNWENLAKTMFDCVEKNGGIYHLWGHSWVIERRNDWNKLQRVLSYIGNRIGVDYVTNYETIDMAN